MTSKDWKKWIAEYLPWASGPRGKFLLEAVDDLRIAEAERDVLLEEIRQLRADARAAMDRYRGDSDSEYDRGAHKAYADIVAALDVVQRGR